MLTGLFLDDERTAWFGPAPTDVAAEPGTLIDLAVADPVEGRLVDVAVRAALGTGADVSVRPGRQTRPTEGRGESRRPPPPKAAPAEGLGALLRFAVPS